MASMRKLKLLWRYRKTLRSFLSAQLSLLEKDGVADALGGLTDEETEGLARWIRSAPPGGTVVEFGTLFGLTTQALAEAAPEGCVVLTVDNFCWNPLGLKPSLHQQFTRRILKPYLDKGRVKLVDLDSATFRRLYHENIPSMVFLDADHSYEAVRDEIAWAKALGVPVITGHDYGNALFGVTRAVDEAFPAGVECVGMCWRAKEAGRRA